MYYFFLFFITGYTHAMHSIPYTVPVVSWAAEHYLLPLIKKDTLRGPQDSIADFLIFNTCIPAFVTMNQYQNRKEILPDRRSNELSYFTPAAIAIALDALSSSDTWANAFFNATCKNIPALGYALYAMFQERAEDKEKERLKAWYDDLMAQSEIEAEQERQDELRQKERLIEAARYKSKVADVLSINVPCTLSQLPDYRRQGICLEKMRGTTQDQMSEKIREDLLKMQGLLDVISKGSYDDILQFDSLYNNLLCNYVVVRDQGLYIDQDVILTPFQLVYAHVILNALTGSEIATVVLERFIPKEALLVRFIERHKKDINLTLRRLFIASPSFALDLHNFAVDTDAQGAIGKVFEDISAYIIRSLQRRIRQKYYIFTKSASS